MAAEQSNTPDLNGIINEMMREYVQVVEEVHLEPQPEEIANVEPETQSAEEEQAVEERATKKRKIAEHDKEGENEDEKDFISAEARNLWNNQLADKGFVGERGFGKLISPFAELIEKRGWGFLYEHKAPGFAAVVREFYANMVEMREDDTVFFRGVWVPFGQKIINEVFKLKDLKHGSKFNKMVDNPDYNKILNLLTAGQGKWETTKKNPHHAINRGSLTEEAKVWFYFICSTIIPTEHLCSVKEQEAMILYALLKGYKMNVGGLIEGSIRGYHLSKKRGLIPHLATITRICILVGVKGVWEEEEKCPRVSPLTLTRVTRGAKGKRQKGIVEVEVEPETKLVEENEITEVGTIPEDIPPAVEEEVPFRMSPLNQSYPEEQEQFPGKAEGSRRRGENAEIMDMLRSMKKDMEERV